MFTLCLMIYETRKTDKRVVSFKLQVLSKNLYRCDKDFKITYNLQLTTYNLQLTTYNLQLTTYNLQLIAIYSPSLTLSCIAVR